MGFDPKHPLQDLAGNFTRPKLIGEYGNIGEIGRVLERAAVYNWYDAFVRKAASLNIPVQLWDNGGDHFNRAARVWRDPTVKDIILTASSGKVNTLPECGYSTVWIKSGESAAKDIKLRWNGNTLVGVYTTSGAALQSGTDYTSGANGITLTPSYLATLPSTVGSLGKVVVKSSEGIDLTIEIRRYALPVIATTSYTAPNVNQDLSIPTNFNGATLAAVKAVKADGVFLKNDWTIWLGEPKAGRLDWGDFDYNSNSVIVKSGTLNMIKNSGQTVTLHFEFWPRSDSTNIVPVTISY
ncbi:hypothetical protein FRC03_000687 [Tulasnella sp. 419]|nr:hypothetical protein FRC03_000687 [Tulasnella sp. 419]